MATLREVAKAAGVSPAAASYALNGTGGSKVNQATRQRVLAMAKSMNFTPNVHAKRLFTKKSEMLGILLPSFAKRKSSIFSDHHLVEIFSGLESAISESTYRLALIFNDDRFAAEKEYLSLFNTHALDGMLIWGNCAEEDFWQEFTKEDHPLLFITPPPALFPDCNFVCHDYRSAGEQVLAHLYGLGHRKILWLGGRKGNGVNDDLEYSFNVFMETHRDVELLSAYCGFHGETIAEDLERFTSDAVDFTAIIGINTITCDRALQHLAALGRTDCAVAACDSNSHDITQYDITRIVVDDLELGRLACSSLLAILSNSAKKVSLRCPVKLQEGATSVSPKEAMNVYHPQPLQQ